MNNKPNSESDDADFIDRSFRGRGKSDRGGRGRGKFNYNDRQRKIYNGNRIPP
jgi:hypothetical protein